MGTVHQRSNDESFHLQYCSPAEEWQRCALPLQAETLSLDQMRYLLIWHLSSLAFEMGDFFLIVFLGLEWTKSRST